MVVACTTRGVLLIVLLSAASADEFLSPTTPEARRAVLLRELHESLEGGRRRLPSEERVARLEAALRPTFAALPKAQNGVVSAASARYALHRLFLQLHGWQIKGLETAGEAWSELSLDDNVGRLLPERLRDLFDERLAQGVHLNELAALAAALEHLIHRESEARLVAIYGALDLPLFGATLDEAGADAAIDAYMMSFLRGLEIQNITHSFMKLLQRRFPVIYKSWGETRDFLRDVRQMALPGKTTEFSFEDVEAVIEEIGERYGAWQKFECSDMTRHLVELEDHDGSGRVRLANFYANTIRNGTYFLKERMSFLRELGVLDESDPLEPRVIIPNYVQAPTNCLAPMTYYAVCCVSACEDLLGDFERQLGAPSATASTILRMVKAIPTSEVIMAGSRSLSANLVERLHDVASFHDGMIPLHGRLFAQWLHHLFPRECPYPQLAGTVKARTPKAYRSETGMSAALSNEDLEDYVKSDTKRRAEAPQVFNASTSSLPWVVEEELVDPKAHRRGGWIRSVLRVAVPLLVLVAIGSATWDLGRRACQGDNGLKPVRGPKLHDV